MTSPLTHILDTYPEIKREFDLTAKRHERFIDKNGREIFRKWFGTILKKIVPNRPEGFNNIDKKVLKWTFARLRKRVFETEGELFAAGNAIFLEEYRKYSLLEQKKEKNRRESFSTIGSLTQKYIKQ